MASLAEQLERWRREVYGRSADAGELRKPSFPLSDGSETEPLYGPAPGSGKATYLRDLGLPGELPYTRGVQATMYRGQLWTMRQYAGFGTAAESNRRYRMLLAGGSTGLSVAFDLPTQMGLDSDDPLAKGEVGKVGVAIDSIEDMHVLLDAIPLERVSTSMTINATAAILLGLYQVVAEERGIPPSALRGTIQNDILKEYVARGTYIYPPGPSLRLITDVFVYARDAIPQWNTISVSGYHIREAGCDAVQEVGLTLAHGLAYVQAAIDRGLGLQSFLGRVSFFFNVHNHFLEEVAKFRAARRLWARLLLERWPSCPPKHARLRFHTQTAGSTLTAQQPDNNVVRVTLQALAAVLGGTQSLHTNSRDEALGLPTEAAARLALRTQQIIACESGVTDVIDPLGGSYAVEALTDRIEAGARALIERIDRLGGVVRAIETGFSQKQVQDSAYRWQHGVDSGSIQVVGVNCYQQSTDGPTEVLRVDPALERDQCARVAAVRAGRDAARVREALTQLGQVARGDGNLMPPIVACIRARATIGEIAGRLREVFGKFRETIVV
jgi:methylmalonyl-CoA mutase N-terminal domain/subunit